MLLGTTYVITYVFSVSFSFFLKISSQRWPEPCTCPFSLFLLPKGNVFFFPDKHYEPVYSVIELKILDLQLLTLWCAHDVPSAGTHGYLEKTHSPLSSMNEPFCL